MAETDAVFPTGPPAIGLNEAAESDLDRSADRDCEEEWAACYRSEMPYLVRYLMKTFGDFDIQDAADAAHSAFVELLKQWDNVDSRRGWLRTVGFRMMLQQSARREYPMDALPLELASLDSAVFELGEQEREVLAALHRLPLKQRQVFALIYDGFTYGEIAAIVGISEDAARKNVERARARLKELLGVTDMGPGVGRAG